jgi:hypothetical protein
MDVEIVPYHMFISNKQFVGVMKSSYLKDFHTLKLKLEFFKIVTNDKKLIEMVAKSCLQDNTTVNPLKIVSNQLVYSKVMNVDEAESFRNYLYFVNNRPFLEDQQNGVMWNIQIQFPGDMHYFVVTLSTNQVLRLYNYVNTYYSQHQYLNLLARTYLETNGKTEPEYEEKKVTEYVNSNRKEEVKEEVKNVEVPETKTDFEDIFGLCLTPTIKASLIHYTMNYFRFFKWDDCKIIKGENEQIKVVCPVLLPGKMGMDEEYFQSLIVTSTLHLNSITFVIRKILSSIEQNIDIYSNKPLHLVMVSYLLLLYMMRYSYDTNRDSFRRNFFKYICSPRAQNYLFAQLIKTSFNEFSGKILFDIKELYEFEKNNDINMISSSYKHLLPISQEDFADKVFEILQEKKSDVPIDFTISNKKILNILPDIKVNGNSRNNVSTKLFDPNNSLNPEELAPEIKLLTYEKIDEKIISKAYKYLLDYIKDPTSLLMIKEKDVPKEVINLFDLLSKNILNSNSINKETNSTFYFYNLLLDQLPNAKLFKHSTMLYIIYQIIIPYCYDLYGTTHYQDCFI